MMHTKTFWSLFVTLFALVLFHTSDALATIPVSTSFATSTNEDTTLTVDLTPYASDLGSNALTFYKYSVYKGTVTITSAGIATFKPSANYFGTEAYFTFYVKNSTGVSSTKAKVSITVKAVNDAPVAAAVTASPTEDVAKSISLSAMDVDSTLLTYAIVSSPSHGTLGSISGKTVNYTPAANYNGLDSFTYKVTDDKGAVSNTATVTIAITAVNDAPTASNVTASTREGKATTLSLNAADVDGDALTYSFSTPTGGTVSESGGTYTYTPTTGYSGVDTFTYTVSDGSLSASANVTVTVLPSTWAAALSASQTSPVTVGGTDYFSTSKLSAAWTAPSGISVDHYELTATDSLQSTSETAKAEATVTGATLENLKSATTYTVTLKACDDADCASYASADAGASGTTPEEVWQIQGSGNSYSGATRIVTDGSSLPYVLAYGSDAPSDLAGKYKFYYGASPNSSWGEGLRIATSTTTSTESSLLATFSAIDAGIKVSCDTHKNSSACVEGGINIHAVQPIPLASSAAIQLVFEAQTLQADESSWRMSSRLFAVDSQDGYVGEDFNTNGSTAICNSVAGENDLATGGECAAKVIIGLDTDSAADGGGSGMSDLHQSKVGYPELDSWKWNQSAGTFMAVGGTSTLSCGGSQGIYYAVFDGTQWAMDKGDDGCPKQLIKKAHGPTLQHLGDVRYKLYYESGNNTSDTEKPLKVLYADGTLTGDATVVDFEDWETEDQARDVSFLWPDNSTLNSYQESGLGDHDIMITGSDLSHQYMTADLGGTDDDTPTTGSEGLGYLVLVNP